MSILAHAHVFSLGSAAWGWEDQGFLSGGGKAFSVARLPET